MGKRVAWNILAFIAGIFVGSVANMILVNLGPILVPLPEGADVTSMEGVKSSMKLFKPANFLFPFLGHAVGTLVGAWVASKLAATHAFKLAIGIGFFFLIGGIVAVRMIGGPLWFQVVDLVLAYIPMAYWGAYLAGVHRPNAS